MMTPRRRSFRDTACSLAALVPLAGAEEDPADTGRIRALERRVGELERRLTTRPVLEPEPAPAADTSLVEHLSDELRSLQIHGAVSQGFLWSDRNDYLSLKTSRGSFAWTSATLNVTKRLGDKLSAGLQIHTYQLGEFGEFDFLLDYAHLDYRWRDWLGVRIGRNKTRSGLYGDSIDFDFLYPWAVPPFSVYDPSRRGTIGHDGLDVYGHLDCGDWGEAEYLVWIGGATIPDNGGYAAEVASIGLAYDRSDVHYLVGGDLSFRPSGALSGLRLGFSHSFFEFDAYTSGLLSTGMSEPWTGLPPLQPLETRINTTSAARVYAPYLEWQHGNWWLAAEYKGMYYHFDLITTAPGQFPIVQHVRQDQRGWYAMAAYRFDGHELAGHDLGWLQLSASWSQFHRDWKADHDPPANYSRDLTGTVRIDIDDGWYLKLEAHHIHGAATFPTGAGTGEPSGFTTGGALPATAAGASPTTLLAVKAGVSF